MTRVLVTGTLNSFRVTPNANTSLPLARCSDVIIPVFVNTIPLCF